MTYKVILPLILLVFAIILATTIGIVATRQPSNGLRISLDAITTTSVSTAAVSTTTAAPTAPPLSSVPSCAGASRQSVSYNHTLILPQGSVFSYNVLGGDMIQSFLDGDLIETDAITSAVQNGGRFLISELDSMTLKTLSLSGSDPQEIFVWQFTNVYGLIQYGSYVYALTDTNELIRLSVGQTYAIITMRVTLSEPSRYLTIDPNAQQPYLLLHNGTIATLNIEANHIQSVCTPAVTDYRNIGFNSDNNMVASVAFAYDILSL